MRQLPTPAGWTSRPALTVLVALFGAVIIGFCLVETVAAIGQSDAVSAAVAGTFAIGFIAFAASIALSRRRSTTLRAISDSAGTTFLPDPIAMASTVTAFIAMAISSACFLFAAARGRHISMVPVGREVHALFLMACLLLISAIGLAAFATRGRNTYFRISESQIEYADILRTRTLPWDQVADITDAAPKAKAHHPIIFVRKDSEDAVVVPNLDGYAPSGAALYWTVRHYWLHPESRRELTDGRALGHLEAQDLKPE